MEITMTQSQKERWKEIKDYFDDKFMVPEVGEEDFYEIETEGGETHFLPLEIVGVNPPIKEICAYIGDPVESCSLIKRGFIVRLSAPGYTDCTDWNGFDTMEEVLNHIETIYMED